MTLVARNVFADLFLREEQGRIFQREVGVGKLTEASDPLAEFLAPAGTSEKPEGWLAESNEKTALTRAPVPQANQCIGFSGPLGLAEAGSADTP
jgi:hypothetical protein